MMKNYINYIKHICHMTHKSVGMSYSVGCNKAVMKNSYLNGDELEKIY